MMRRLNSIPILKRRLNLFSGHRPISSLGGQLLVTLVGVTCISLSMVVGVVIWETRAILTQQKGESFQALALSSSQRLVEELDREIELLENLSEEKAFFYQAFGATEHNLNTLDPMERETFLKNREQLWQQSDESLTVLIRGHPASSDLERFARTFPSHSQLIYVDSFGALVASGGVPAEQYYYGDEPWWQNVWTDGGGISVRQLTIQPGQQDTAIEIAIPVRLLGTQSAQGVLRSRFLISDLRLFEDFLHLNDIGTLSLVDPNGINAYNSQPEQVGQSIPANLQIQLTSESVGWSRNQNQQNTSVIVGHAQLIPPPKYAYLESLGWTLMVQQPIRDALVIANRLAFFAILGGASVLILAICVSNWIAKRFIRPIQSLTQTAAAMANGNLDSQAQLSGTDEFQSLAKAFNTMTAQLRLSIDTLEQRVQERTVELEQAKDMADNANHAKSEFLANMSHELRTPLNGILGYTQILERSPSLPDSDRKGVHIIHQCGAHLLTLINDVLDLSKIEARKLELNSSALHLPSLLQSVVEMCKIKAIQKGIEFAYHPSSRLPEGIEADEKRLRQVLINLLGNAIKFTDSGSVTLLVDVLNQSPTHASLHFQIMDTGVGIAEDNLTNLFEAFEQVGDRHKQSEGTGLGLAISQRIVRLMGGDIQVRSQLDQGSEFFFTVDVPLTNEWDQAQAENRDVIVGYEGNQRYSILVVDDRWENRLVLQNLLNPLGFTVLEAANGEEGLAVIEEDFPDLVITDLAMPVMNGFELLNHIRGSDDLKAMKVIATSASVAQSDQQMALNHGSHAFLAKPIDATALFSLLVDHLGLEWTYQTPPDVSFSPSPELVELVLPSRPILEELLGLAERNQVKGLRSRLQDLKRSDTTYTAFVDPLLELSQQFQIEEIEEQLQTYLMQESTSIS